MCGPDVSFHRVVVSRPEFEYPLTERTSLVDGRHRFLLLRSLLAAQRLQGGRDGLFGVQPQRHVRPFADDVPRSTYSCGRSRSTCPSSLSSSLPLVNVPHSLSILRTKSARPTTHYSAGCSVKTPIQAASSAVPISDRTARSAGSLFAMIRTTGPSHWYQ